MGRLIEGNLRARRHHVRSFSSGAFNFRQKDRSASGGALLEQDLLGPFSAGPIIDQRAPASSSWEVGAAASSTAAAAANDSNNDDDVEDDTLRPPVVARRPSSPGKVVAGLGGSLMALARRASTTTAEGVGARRTARARTVRRPSASVLDCFPFSTDVARYRVGEIMGFGASAKVHLAKYSLTPGASDAVSVAIKAINTDKYTRNEIENLRKELQIMSLSRHPNVLPVHAAFMPPNSHDLWIVTPLMSAGSCSDILAWRYQRGMPEIAVREILFQALSGLQYLHFFNLVHRDIKAANILVDQDTGVVKIADFGISSSLVDAPGNRLKSRNSFVGTPCWMAPEVVQQEHYDTKADIWSCGITAIEVLTGRAPYASLPPVKVFMMTLQAEPPNLEDWEDDGPNAAAPSPADGGEGPAAAVPRVFSNAAKDFVRTCLRKDPADRPDCARLLKSHPFFKGAKGRFRDLPSPSANSPSSSSSKPATLPQGCVRIVDVLRLAEMTPVQQRVKQRRGNDEDVASTPTWDFGDDQVRPGSSSAERPTKTAHFGSPPGSPVSVGDAKKAGRFTVSRDDDDDDEEERDRVAQTLDDDDDAVSDPSTPPPARDGKEEKEGCTTKKGRFTVETHEPARQPALLSD